MGELVVVRNTVKPVAREILKAKQERCMVVDIEELPKESKDIILNSVSPMLIGLTGATVGYISGIVRDIPQIITVPNMILLNNALSSIASNIIIVSCIFNIIIVLVKDSESESRIKDLYGTLAKHGICLAAIKLVPKIFDSVCLQLSR